MHRLVVAQVGRRTREQCLLELLVVRLVEEAVDQRADTQKKLLLPWFSWVRAEVLLLGR